MNFAAIGNILQKFLKTHEIRVFLESGKAFFTKFKVKPEFEFEDLEVISYLLNKKIAHGKEGLKLIEQEKLSFSYRQIEKHIPYILTQMEDAGIATSLPSLQTLKTKLEEKIHHVTSEIWDLAGQEFNINSPKQVNEILFEKLGLKAGKKTKGGGLSTGADVLEDLAFDGVLIAEKLIEARHLHKLLNTYVDVLIEKTEKSPDSRIHTTFSSTSTLTGRLNSKNPNLQNLPAKTEIGSEIKACFKGAEGFKLIAFDYSQIELRILAHIADVQPLKEAFLNNEDIHARTASAIFEVPLAELSKELRNNAKAINFGIIYGVSAFALAKSLKISTSKAGDYINAYFEKYAGIKKYMEETMEFAKENEFVRTISGKKCYLEGANSSNYSVRSHALRAGINARIQGSAADLIKKAMIDVFKNGVIDENCSLILQIHDELVFEIKAELVEEKAVKIKQIMENSFKLSVPIVVNIKNF